MCSRYLLTFADGHYCLKYEPNKLIDRPSLLIYVAGPSVSAYARRRHVFAWCGQNIQTNHNYHDSFNFKHSLGGKLIFFFCFFFFLFYPPKNRFRNSCKWSPTESISNPIFWRKQEEIFQIDFPSMLSWNRLWVVRNITLLWRRVLGPDKSTMQSIVYVYVHLMRKRFSVR